MTTIEKLNAVIDSNVHQILDPLAVQAAQAAITEIETLTRALDAACEVLGIAACTDEQICSKDETITCAACWRQYLLAKAELERTKG